MIKLLKYGNTNTYYIDGEEGILIDTDYAGTLPAFFREIKKNNIEVKKIAEQNMAEFAEFRRIAKNVRICYNM